MAVRQSQNDPEDIVPILNKREPFTEFQLLAGIASQTLPDYSWISPLVSLLLPLRPPWYL